MPGQKGLMVCKLFVTRAFLSGRHKIREAEANESNGYESHTEADQEGRHPTIDNHIRNNGERHDCHHANSERTEREGGSEQRIINT